MNTIKLALSALLAAVLAIGCGIATGTFSFVVEIDGTIASNQASLEWEHIDLTIIEYYNDHKDKIKSVDQVAMVGSIANNGPDVSGEIWLAYDTTYSTPAEVRANSTRIFVSSVIPSGDTLIVNWSDGLAFIENFAAVQDAIELGDFVLYGLGDNSIFDVEMDIDIIVTITAGL